MIILLQQTIKHTFRITSVSAIGITADTIADGNNTITATFTDASNITADVASITYTINVKDSSGNNTEYTRTQINRSFSCRRSHRKPTCNF
jgi:hypothetical protein